jgi:sugar/nucleoside kinase (ribokinase family)
LWLLKLSGLRLTPRGEAAAPLFEQTLLFWKSVCHPLADTKTGAIAQESGGQRIEIKAINTVVADTTGAGDSFAGGFIAAQISDGDLRASVVAGVTLAATCVANIGARPQGGHAL